MVMEPKYYVFQGDWTTFDKVRYSVGVSWYNGCFEQLEKQNKSTQS